MKNKARQTQRNTRRISAIRNKTTQSNRTEVRRSSPSEVVPMMLIALFFAGVVGSVALITELRSSNADARCRTQTTATDPTFPLWDVDKKFAEIEGYSDRLRLIRESAERYLKYTTNHLKALVAEHGLPTQAPTLALFRTEFEQTYVAGRDAEIDQVWAEVQKAQANQESALNMLDQGDRVAGLLMAGKYTEFMAEYASAQQLYQDYARAEENAERAAIERFPRFGYPRVFGAPGETQSIGLSELYSNN